MLRWFKISTMDMHLLRQAMVICDFKNLKWNYADNEKDPPAVFIWCDIPTIRYITNQLGIRKF